MPGRNAQNMPMWAFEGDYHPVKVMDGDKTLFRAKDVTQTGIDMAFERTYNDRVDVVALGRSKQAVTVQGKNLFDWARAKIVDINGTEQPSYGSINDGTYINQMSYHSASVQLTVPSGALVGGNTYTISFEVLSPVNQPIYFGVRNNAGTRTNTTKSVAANTPTYMTLTVTAPAGFTYHQYVQLQGSTSTDPININTVFSNIQLELGSTATPYEPFTPDSPSPDYPSPIISSAGELRVEGRNIANFFNASVTTTGTSSNGAVGWSYPTYVPKSTFNVAQPFVYQITIDNRLGTSQACCRFDARRSDGSFVIVNRLGSYVPSGQIGVSVLLISLTQAQIDQIVDLGFGRYVNNSAGGTTTVSQGMVYYGTEAKPFTPYRPILTTAIPELRAIPDDAGGWLARDELTVERVGGEWRLMMRQRVGHKVLAGMESWDYYNYQPTNSAYARFQLMGVSVPTAVRGMCSSFTWVILQASATNIECVGNIQYQTTLGVIILKSRLAGWNDGWTYAQKNASFKAWFGSNNTEIQYPLATPIITDLGVIDLPSYYPHTRVLVTGDYPPDVTARCRVTE